MAKAQLFTGPSLRIESRRDHNGRTYTAWKPHVSMWFNERKALLRWLAWPPKTPTGDALRAWLDDLDAADQQRQQPMPDGLSAEQIATGFGPEVHSLDDSDPQFQTRTVI
jgi:hypothetical protein